MACTGGCGPGCCDGDDITPVQGTFQSPSSLSGGVGMVTPTAFAPGVEVQSARRGSEQVIPVSRAAGQLTPASFGSAALEPSQVPYLSNQYLKQTLEFTGSTEEKTQWTDLDTAIANGLRPIEILRQKVGELSDNQRTQMGLDLVEVLYRLAVVAYPRPAQQVEAVSSALEVLYASQSSRVESSRALATMLGLGPLLANAMAEGDTTRRPECLPNAWGTVCLQNSCTGKCKKKYYGVFEAGGKRSKYLSCDCLDRDPWSPNFDSSIGNPPMTILPPKPPPPLPKDWKDWIRDVFKGWMDSNERAYDLHITR